MTSQITNQQLLTKYNVPVPRYTSYPTVPYWQENIDADKWKTNFSDQFTSLHGEMSLYIHLPFCESLCTYCGCNKKITKNHSVEDEYIDAVLSEWDLYKQLMSQKPVIRELHLGGGTPTFFSPANLKKLIGRILGDCSIAPDHEFSFEGHPNNTTKEHLQTLFDLGFRRVSFGVQDNDPEVQFIINRIQPFDNVKNATELARSIGYKSVNFDLIYGLPLQTTEKMARTLAQTISLRPDRVAFYSYAHVPWTSKGQRLFDEKDLPATEEKMKLYQLGKEMFAASGYTDIGMDHFALPDDTLHEAAKNGKVYRNFMGYTTQNSKILLGLGVSAISDTGTAFAQNNKTLHDYYADIKKGELSVTKGYFLSNEDIQFKTYILDIACKGRVKFNPVDKDLLTEYTFPLLNKLKNDGLITFTDSEVIVTKSGHNFLRNIASAFDLHLQRSSNYTGNKFSQAI